MPTNTTNITGFGGRARNSLNRQRKLSSMRKAQVRALSPRVWNTTGNLHLTLAARHDANFNYVTVSVRKMIQEGLIPMTFEEFYGRFEQGDIFLLQLNGQVNVNAKLNRESKLTMAFHCPRIVEMPKWNVDGSTTVTVDAVMYGYTGIRLSKETQPRQMSNQPAPLDPRLDTPAERVVRVVQFEGANKIVVRGESASIEWAPNGLIVTINR